MPNPSDFNSESEWMHACVPKMMQDKGMAQDQAVAACMNMWKNEGEDSADSAHDSAEKAETYGGTPRDKLNASDFVFPDERKFPVMTEQDVHDAVSSWGRYKGPKSFEEFKRRLTALAKRKGLEGALPASWDAPAGKFAAVKAMTEEGKVDVTAVPFGTDSDAQTFDSTTDCMLSDFSAPAILYHHGVMPGKKALQQKPVIIGKSLSVEKRMDGIHIIAQLNMAMEWARKVWDAAKKGEAVASSDSIAHLARLDVGGRQIMYEKGRPGRISVWPLAGVSLWEKAPGNFNPASRNALVLPMPAMKAIYREAGLAFPELDEGTHGDLSYADQSAARRAEKERILKKAREILAKSKEI